MKPAPITDAMRRRDKHLIVRTQHHYDPLMSDRAHSAPGVPAVEANLEVGSGSHGQQTRLMLESPEGRFVRLSPDCEIT